MQAKIQANDSVDTSARIGGKARPVKTFDYVQSVVGRLRIVKDGMTYSEMEAASGIHSTLLCRYVTGSTRPSREQAQHMEKTILRKSSFKDRLKKKMVLTENGYLDLHQISCDPNALRWIACEVESEFSRIKCSCVMTAASSGISLATAVAIEMRVPLVYATHTKSSGARSYFDVDLQSTNPSEIASLYLPMNFLSKGDSILIVDDVATSGRTLSGLAALVNKAGCKLSGVFVLASRSDNWKELIRRHSADNPKISVLFEMSKDEKKGSVHTFLSTNNWE